MHPSKAVRTIALIEGAKGLLVLAAGFGAISLLHRDAQQVAEDLVRHLHLNPAKTSPRIFVEYAGKLTDARLGALAALAMTYASVRFVEAYGLWRDRRWAEWFGVVTGAIYVPFEIFELWRGGGWMPLAALAVNLAVVGFLARALMQRPAAAVPGP